MQIIDKLPQQIFIKHLPHISDDRFLPLFEVDHVEIIPEMYLLKVNNAQLFEDGSIVLNNKVLPQSVRDSAMLKMYSRWRIFRRLVSYKKETINNDNLHFTLLDHWGHEYYHWFFDSLPRLEFALRTYPNMVLVLSDRYLRHDYVRESLKFFPIEIRVLGKKTILKSKELYLSTFAGPSDYHREELLTALRNRLRLPGATGNRRIYLSRSKARYRKITNENQVIDCLKKYDFEILRAEELPWDKQRELFSQVSHLVALHGAGLTNILFMAEKTRVLEIRKNTYGKMANFETEKSKFYNTYYHICSTLNLTYYSLPSPAPDDDVLCHYSDVTVEIDELEASLRQMLM